MKKKAVIITEQGYEDEEVIYPVIRLKEAGFEVDLATKDCRLVMGRKNYPLETLVKFYANLVDATRLNPESYDLVIIPGGFEGPDRVRQIPEVLEFIKLISHTNKVLAAICHGPWVLISAGLLKGKKVTGYAGIKDDIINSGAEYVNQAVVEDNNIITGAHARDLGEFMSVILNRFK